MSHSKFWSYFEKSEGCWLWTGPLSKEGYGRTKQAGEWYAHRASWVLHRGPIPEGLELDHLCRNTRCVNPDHLEPVTHAENVRRGLTKLACLRGHFYTPENTVTFACEGRKKRHCGQCMQIRNRLRYKRDAA
jgi:hypothetical protein